MKNQLCFTLKVRSGARTPIELSCDMLCVNNESINIHGHEVSAASISLLVVDTLKREFGRLQTIAVVNGSHRTTGATVNLQS